MATSVISTPAQVTSISGRSGTCLYDNPAVTNNEHKSAIVIFRDGTWKQSERSNLTVVSGNAFATGMGPGA